MANFIDQIRNLKNKVIYVSSNGQQHEFTNPNEAADFMENNGYYSVDYEDIGTTKKSNPPKNTTSKSTQTVSTPKQKAYRRKFGDWVKDDPLGAKLANASSGESITNPDYVWVTEDGKIASNRKYQAGNYDLVQDQTWDQLYGPSQADPLRQPTPVDFNFLSPRTGTQNYWINRQNGVFYDPAMTRAMDTNTFKGWSDMYAANHNAAANSPVYQSFRQANDFVGNRLIDLFTLGAAGNAINAGRELVADMGLKAATKWFLPRAVAGAAGAYVGGQATDQAVNAATNGAVPSWSYGMQSIGAEPLEAAITNPGTWAGSYLGTRGYDWVDQNWPNMWWNFQQGFPRMAPFNANGEAVMVQPGETVQMEGVSTPTLYGTRGAGTRWSGQGTVQGHRGATPQARGSHQVSSGGGVRGKGKTTSVTPRHEQQVMNTSARGPIPSTTNVPAHVTPDPATGFWFPLPYGGATPPPAAPPVVPPMAPPVVPEYRHVVKEQSRPKFDIWFEEQINDGNYGTTQYYPGDNQGFGPGNRRIIWGGNYNPVVETREVYTDPQGFQVPDSSTYRLTNVRRPRSQRKVEGGVPKEARVDPSKRIDVSKSE